jgi:diguanylate cyclase (GGDEF)-like protein/PAS domain S-box-containing protein
MGATKSDIIPSRLRQKCSPQRFGDVRQRGGPALPASLAAEAERLASLRRMDLLDTAAEPEFDELVELAAAICGTPMGLITLVDEHRQWFKAAQGIGVRETPIDVSFCLHAIRQPGIFVIEDAADDARFAQNPLVLGEPHVRFYAGIPIHSPDGLAVGTLCVVDNKPRTLSQTQTATLHVLGRQVSARLELREQRKTLESALRDAEDSRTALTASEERFRTFMDSSPFVSFMKGLDGKYVYYNRPYARRFGVDAEERLGKTDFDMWPADQAAAFREHDNEVMRTGVLRMFEEETTDAEGAPVHWRSYKFPSRDALGRPLIAVVAVDVTEEIGSKRALEKAQVTLQEANERLQELAVTDVLTGLRNRRVFDERMGEEMTSARRESRLSLLLLDIDGLKERNDRFGHLDGDEVLKQLGALMRQHVRGTDLAVRLGGDEFGVLMPQASEEQAAGLAARLLRAVRESEWKHQPLTVSIGIAERRRGQSVGSELVTAADQALYAAKAAGRDRIVRQSEMA